VRTSVSGISVLGRDTQGVKLISLGEGEHLSSIERIVGLDEEIDETDETEPGVGPDSSTDATEQPE